MIWKGLHRCKVFGRKLRNDPDVRPKNCMQQIRFQLSLMVKSRVGGEKDEREIFDH